MNRTAEDDLLADWDAWAEAIASNDAERIGSFVSDDWVIVGGTGVMGKADFLGWVASGDLTHEAFGRVGEPRIRVYGDTAVLTVHVVNNGHYSGNPFSADEWTTDVYLNRDGRWLCVASQITPVMEM